MEIFGLILGLLVVATFFLPWINLFAIRRMRDDLEQLRRQIGGAPSTDAVPSMVQAARARAEEWHDRYAAEKQKTEEAEAKADEAESVIGPEPVMAEAPTPSAALSVPRVEAAPVYSEVAPSSPPRRASLEQNIGTKISVWLGAIALIFAAFYLVKYSIDQGFLSPAVRLALSGLFGAGLIAAGQWLCSRMHIANAARIAQGLVGAGIVTLYVCFYAALNLYHLIPPGLAFAGMAVVTAVSVVMSLRHGQPIAIFGIVGGLLTPLLVNTDAPSAVMLFTYLFLLYAGVIFFLVRNGWWLLSILLLGGILLWPVFWLFVAFDTADYRTVIFFAGGVCLASLFATGNRARAGEQGAMFRGFNAAAMLGAALIIFSVGFKVTLDLFDWSMLELISLAILALVFFSTAQYRNILLAKIVLDLILFALWARTAPPNDILFVTALMGTVYVALPLWLMLRTGAGVFAPLQAVFAASLGTIGYFVLHNRFENENAWAIGAIVLAAGFTGLAHIAVRLFRGYPALDVVLASYASAASFFIAAGLSIILPAHYLPLAFAGQILATLLIQRATQLYFLQKIAFVIAGIFAFLSLDYLGLFALTMLTSLYGGTADELHGAAEHIDFTLLLPAILLGASYYLALPFAENTGRTLRRVLLALTLGLGLGYAYILTRQMFHAADVFDITAGFIERGCITVITALAAAVCFYIHRARGWDGMKGAAAILAVLVLARMVWFDLLIHNPYFDRDQYIGDMPFLHAGTLLYGGGAAACAAATRFGLFRTNGFLRGAANILGLVFLFLAVTINVTQYFHKGYILSGGETTESELYAYSIVWLLTGLALLATGIRYGSRTARIASLCFILLTVLKVFLIDAAELKDLYRVFSFLGLGASLIGLSFFYSRYVFRRKEPERQELDKI